MFLFTSSWKYFPFRSFIALLLPFESTITFFVWFYGSKNDSVEEIEPYNVVFVNGVPLPTAHTQGFWADSVQI